MCTSDYWQADIIICTLGTDLKERDVDDVSRGEKKKPPEGAPKLSYVTSFVCESWWTQKVTLPLLLLSTKKSQQVREGPKLCVCGLLLLFIASLWYSPSLITDVNYATLFVPGKCVKTRLCAKDFGLTVSGRSRWRRAASALVFASG